MTEKLGHRGYITSRPVRGQMVPHKVQNLVVRDYCQRMDLVYLLSATEYAMDGCYMMLKGLLVPDSEHHGIVLYSQFMLPAKRTDRLSIYDAVLQTGLELHGALENVSITSRTDVETFEQSIAIVGALPLTPMQGHYSKNKVSQSEREIKSVLLSV